MADNNGFDIKDEFHITVIGFKNGSIFRENIYGLPEAERSYKLTKINDLIDETDWGFEIEPRCYHISNVIESKTKTEKKLGDNKESYVQMINLPAISDFYNRLNVLLSTSVLAPPAHITLYTKEDENNKYKGIAIDSIEEFTKLNPELIF